MRLAIIVNRFPALSETFIFNKATGLRRSGVDVVVHTHYATEDGEYFEGTVDGEFLPSRSHSVHQGGRARLPFRVARLMARCPVEGARLLNRARDLYSDASRATSAWLLALPLATRNFDVIHFEYSGLAARYLDAFPLLRPAKLVTSCRGAAEQIRPVTDPERAKTLARVFEAVDRVHCVSEDMLRTVERFGLDATRAFVNRPSIDATRFERRLPYVGRATGPYSIVSTGRLHWKKGFEYALQAIRELVDAGYDIHYDILGSGLERDRLLFDIHDLGLVGRVALRGACSADEVRDALDRADVFLLPSLSEGLSNAALEAMAMGLPVVSTSAGGMAEAIRDGENGRIVDPRNPSQLADAVRALLDAPALRQQLGAAARQTVETQFTLSRQIDKFVAEYQGLA